MELWQLIDQNVMEFLKKKIKKKELKVVVCGFISYFRDDVMDVCSKCGRVLYIRPAIQDIANRYKVPIVCMDCADKKEVATATVEALEHLMKNAKTMGEK